MSDRETLEVYAAKAEDYAEAFLAQSPDADLRRFMDALPPGGRVLDLGCGPGSATAFMLEAGFDVDPTDASREMAEVAKTRFGIDVRISTFDELAAQSEYDGVFANFSLLHAKKADLPRHLAAISRALKPSGTFHIGTKVGDGEKRDALGRFYAYYREDELTALLEEAGFDVIHRRFGAEAGLAGDVSPFMIFLARKTADE